MGEKIRDVDLSVIVPVHNESADLLRRLLDSLDEQGIEKLEILVINDGSVQQRTIQYEAVCSEYEEAKLINLVHSGVSRARNVGVDSAVGKYIAFADADDILPPNALKDLICSIEQSVSDIAIGCVDVGYPNGRVHRIGLTRSGVITREDAIRLFLHKKLTEGVWGKVFRAELLGALRFDENLAICEDALYFFQAINNSCQVSTVALSCYIYEKREGSQSQNGFDDRYYGVLSVAGTILSVVEESGSLSLLTAAYRYYLSKHLDCIRSLFRFESDSAIRAEAYAQIRSSLNRVPECMNYATVGQRIELLLSRSWAGAYRLFIWLFDKVMR